MRVPCLTRTLAPSRSGFGREPAQGGVEVGRGLTDGPGRRDRVTAGDVELIGQAQRHGLRGAASAELAAGEVDPGDGGGARGLARGQDADLVPQFHGAFGDLAGVGAVVAVGLGIEAAGDGVGGQRALRPDDQLDREAEAFEVAFEFVGGRQRLEDLEQRRAVVPGRPLRAVHHVVAVERGHGNDQQIGDRRRQPSPSSRPTCWTSASIPRNTSSLKSTRSILFTATITCATRSSCSTDRCRRVCSRTPLRASMSTTTASAVDAPVTVFLVYCTCPGQSARMKLRAVRGEVAVGDVDGDALLALGAQAVGQQGEVDRFCAGAPSPPNPRSAEVRATASSWSARIAFESCRSRPTRVDLPSSTEPAVAKRNSVVGSAASTRSGAGRKRFGAH